MSPIGRVFIVLNLLLAGTFVGFAGTYLQRQDDYKSRWEASVEAAAKEKDQLNTRISGLESTANASEVAKAAAERDRERYKGDYDRVKDDNDAKDRKIAEQDASIKTLASSAQAVATEVATAFRQAKDAADKAIAAEQVKDAAVREKDDAVAAKKDADLKIASLEETVTNKDLEIAALGKKNGELDLLVSVARVKGFLDTMAVPPLSGTVSQVAGRLCTIQISNNPTNAEIKPGYSFMLYDGSTYKGEAVVQNANAEKNVAFCRIDLKTQGEIKQGDKASTGGPGN